MATKKKNEIAPRGVSALKKSERLRKGPGPAATIAVYEQRFIDKKELRKRLSLPSTRAVDELMRAKRIPFLRLGHRTVRFDWPKVEALARFEVKETGRIEEAA